MHPTINPQATERICEERVRKTIGLDELPHKVSKLNEDAVRELRLYSYRILYKIKPDNFIEGLAVIHKRRHLESEYIPREQ